MKWSAISFFLYLSIVSGAQDGVGEQADTASSHTAPAELVIDNFDKGLAHGVFTGRKNTVGAYQGTWARRPSYSLLRKSEVNRRGDAGKGAILEWKKEGGWCGWYTLLNDASGKPADASSYNALCFWVKGENGGEKFDIGFADAEMQSLEIDAIYAGAVNTFLKGGITKEWQEVKVPLSRIESSMDLSAMGSLVFWFREGGSGKIYLDDIVFRNDPSVTEMEEYNAPRAERDPKHPRAFWVWKWDPINNLKSRKGLLEMCRRCALDRIFQFIGDFNADDDPEYTKRMEEFLEEAHALNIKVEALTGNPVWSLRENHPACIKWIQSFLDYNQSRPESRRFDGVSLDVEPYLTGEWNVDKANVKEEYLELLRKCRELIDGYPDQKFHVGAAIPMAYEQEEKADGFESKVLGYLDYIALMAYYDTPKKVIDASRFHVDLCTKLNKQVWLGVEIQDLVQMKQGNRGNTYWEEGWIEMENVLGKVQEHFYDDPGYGGLAMHCCYAYKILQREKNVPTKDRLPPEQAKGFTLISKKTNVPLTLDGKLDDWDLSRPHVMDKKDDVSYGRGAWTGPTDFSVKSYSMWDIENLYFAFELTDDAVIQKKTAADMWEGDHIEFWLDVDLMGDYTEAANGNDDFQFGFSPGDFDQLPAEVFIWTPFMEEDYKEAVPIASRKTDKGWIIEVKIPQEFLIAPLKKRIGVDPAPAAQEANAPAAPAPVELGAGPRFEAGTRLGLCVDPSDCDNPDVPQKLLMSTSGEGRIWGDPTTFGFLLLADEEGHVPTK